MRRIILVVSIIILFFILINISVSKTDNPPNKRYKIVRKKLSSSEDAENAGKNGEILIKHQLSTLLNENEYLISNILFPLKNGYKTEIDCVLISYKGIFCIEIKNWVGLIKGNNESEHWIQVYDDPRISNREHINPVKQNYKHCLALLNIINKKYSINNIIIFTKLEYYGFIDSDNVFTFDSFENFYNSLEDTKLDDSEIITLYNSLKPYIATPDQLEEHKEKIKERFKSQ